MPRQDVLHKPFGCGPRNQHTGADFELPPEKSPFAKQILHRLVHRGPPDQVPQGGPFLRGGGAVKVRVEVDGVRVDCAGHQPAGDKGGLIDRALLQMPFDPRQQRPR